MNGLILIGIVLTMVVGMVGTIKMLKQIDKIKDTEQGMEANIQNIIGVIGIMGLYIVLKVWVYSKEYDTKDKVIKRGKEWD